VVKPVAAKGRGEREINPVKVSLALYAGDKKVGDVKPVALERGEAAVLYVTGSGSSLSPVWVTRPVSTTDPCLLTTYWRNNMIPVILSGGSGSRLWPLSRKQFPKQFLALTGEHTLFQQTLERLVFEGMDTPIVVCNKDHRSSSTSSWPR
jgi:hypothetical protein